MAFASANLALVFVGGGGFAKRYAYTTADTLPTVQASGYFDSTVALKGLDVGDIITVTVVDFVPIATRTSVTGITELVVASNDGTTITTSQMTRAGNIINVTAATISVTAALHANRIITLGAASITATMPLASGTGNVYTFFTTVTAAAQIITAVSAADSFGGGVALSSDIAGVTMLSNADTDTITMDGAETGGVIGSWIKLTDIVAGKYMLDGFLATTGDEATPFSAT